MIKLIKNKKNNNKLPNNSNFNIDNFLVKIHNRRSIRRELAGLIFKNYYRTFQYLFFSLGQPLIIFIILYFVFTKLLQTPEPPSAVISGYTLLAPIAVSLFASSNMLSSWKQSVLLKRIDVTRVTKAQFLLTFFSFFFCIAILSFLWTVLWAFILTAASPTTIGGIKYDYHEVFSHLNWGWLFAAVVCLIVICNSVAFLIVGISTNEDNTQATTQLFYFPNIFLTGIMFPAVLLDSYKAVKWISYFLPMKFAAYLSNVAWSKGSPGNTLSFMDPFFRNNPWMLIILSLVWTGIILSIASRKFKWAAK